MKHWRSHVAVCFLFLFGAAIVGRLAFLQIIDYGFYKALAQGQQNVVSFEKGERGSIFLRDRSGNLQTLAANQRTPLVFASPPEIEDTERTAALLSETLQIDKQEILEKFRKQTSLYQPLKKNISEQEKQALADLDLPGVYVGREHTRAYPQKDLASHVIGFANKDGQGQYGVEEYYHAVLQGEEGLKSSGYNPAAYLLSAFKSTRADGANIVLTLDPNIQSVAEHLLDQAAQRLGAAGGTIIVLDPRKGTVTALANTPRFDPNAYAQVQDLELFQNPAVQKLYEPGSIFKPLTMAAALDANALTPSTTYVDTGIVQIGGRKILNYDQRTWGERTMTEVLEYSINTGAVFAEQRLGHEQFLAYMERFGIFEPTNVGLAGEIYSLNEEFKKGYEINFATAAFGQGIEMTPLQIARAFSAIANDGVLVSPSIREGQGAGERQRRVISSETASQVSAMLQSVVQNGFAKAAQIPGYHVAGKTGTAQIPWSALGVSRAGYSDQTIQSFVGYAPAFDAKFLILVKLDNPQTKTAEYSAIPVFRDLAKYLIDYYQIPPDYEVE